MTKSNILEKKGIFVFASGNSPGVWNPDVNNNEMGEFQSLHWEIPPRVVFSWTF